MAIEAFRLKLDDIHNPGPGFVPFFLGLSLVVLSLLSLFFPDRRSKMAAFWNDWSTGQNICYILAVLIFYLLLFKILGFYADTFLLMVFLTKLSGEKSLKRCLLIATGTVASIYLVFDLLLFIPFPKGGLHF